MCREGQLQLVPPALQECPDHEGLRQEVTSSHHGRQHYPKGLCFSTTSFFSRRQAQAAPPGLQAFVLALIRVSGQGCSRMLAGKALIHLCWQVRQSRDELGKEITSQDINGWIRYNSIKGSFQSLNGTNDCVGIGGTKRLAAIFISQAARLLRCCYVN